MSDTAYVIPVTHYDSEKGYRVGIAKQGEKGYYLTDWFWGHDYEQAQKIADEKNIRMCGSLDEANKIICSSMFSKGR